jgi:hypothetical protein
MGFDPAFGVPTDLMQPIYRFFDNLFGSKPKQEKVCIGPEFSDGFVKKTNQKLGDHVTLLQSTKTDLVVGKAQIGGDTLNASLNVGNIKLPNATLDGSNGSIKASGSAGFTTISAEGTWNITNKFKVFGEANAGGLKIEAEIGCNADKKKKKKTCGFKFGVTPGVAGGSFGASYDFDL